MRPRLFNVRGFIEEIGLHQFRDCVAVHFRQNDGGGRDPVRMETAYLTARMAREFADALRDFATAIEANANLTPRRIES